MLCFLTHLCCTVMNFSLYKKYMHEKNAIFVKEGNFIRFLYQRNLHRYTVYVTSWVFIGHVNRIGLQDWQKLTIKNELELRNWVTLQWNSREEATTVKPLCTCANVRMKKKVVEYHHRHIINHKKEPYLTFKGKCSTQEQSHSSYGRRAGGK